MGLEIFIHAAVGQGALGALGGVVLAYGGPGGSWVLLISKERSFSRGMFFFSTKGKSLAGIKFFQRDLDSPVRRRRERR